MPAARMAASAGPRPAGNFPVDRDAVRPDFRQLFHKLQRRFNHQVHIQRPGRQPAHGTHHQRPKGDGRYKMPVHHINVEGIDPGGFGGGDVPVQAGKVRRQNRSAEFKHGVPPAG